MMNFSDYINITLIGTKIGAPSIVVSVDNVFANGENHAN